MQKGYYEWIEADVWEKLEEARKTNGCKSISDFLRMVQLNG